MHATDDDKRNQQVDIIRERKIKDCNGLTGSEPGMKGVLVLYKPFR
jgi:hypothetical protein